MKQNFGFPRWKKFSIMVSSNPSLILSFTFSLIFSTFLLSFLTSQKFNEATRSCLFYLSSFAASIFYFYRFASLSPSPPPSTFFLPFLPTAFLIYFPKLLFFSLRALLFVLPSRFFFLIDLFVCFPHDFPFLLLQP